MNIKLFVRRFKVKLKLFYIIFISSPKNWRAPKKVEILVYDANTTKEVLIPLLKKYNFDVLAIRGEFINIPCLLRSFLGLNFWRGDLLSAYIESYILAVQPKIIITLNDNNRRFFCISKRFPNLKTIFFQNGLKGYTESLFDILIKSPSYHVDYMFVISDAIGKYYLKYMTGKYIPVGTLRNNNVIKKYTSPKSNDILFISQWCKKPKNGEPFWVRHDGGFLSWETVFSVELKVIKLLAKWCMENNKKLKICGHFPEKELKRLEENFYIDSIGQIKCMWEYVQKKNYPASYNLVDESHIIVSIDSTLGYESLARGKKTAFFSCRGDYIKDSSYRFGWPLELPNKGPMWISNQDELECELPKIMDYLNTVSENDWKENCQHYKNLIMELDQGNKQLIKLLNQLLSEKEKYKLC